VREIISAKVIYGVVDAWSTNSEASIFDGVVMDKKNIENQINTIERALGERMINHALVVVQQWVTQIGDMSYVERIDQIDRNYEQVFGYYLSIEDPERDKILDDLTTETYRLVDEVYASIRVNYGLSPNIHNFNPEHLDSVIRYFSSCVQIQPDDFDWLRQKLESSADNKTLLAATVSLGRNLRECFSEDAMLYMVDAAASANTIIADQAMASLILLLAHYDVRIDFFPTITEAFEAAVGDGERAFEILMALIRSINVNIRDLMANSELDMDNLPEPIQELLGMDGNKPDSLEKIVSWMPESEKEYLAGVMAMLPDTWVFSLIVGENETRIQEIQKVYLLAGKMDLLWDQLDVAEQLLVERLSSNKATTMDYINYGHCCFVRGDRMMAFENYREARIRCKSAKSFFTMFRPDRRFLVEHGVPLDQVYLMEDKLLVCTK